jgi:hypothetical protein
MPTDDTGNGQGPTATDVNASQDFDVTALPAEKIESHPYVQELKKKYSAAHSDMDKTNLSKKELQAEVARLKVLAGEEAPQEVKEEPQTVTKAELQEQVWELKHAHDVEIYGDEEFKKDVQNGIPRDYALNTAKLRFQSNPDHARLERQRTMASGTAMGTRNLESEDLEGFDPVEAAKWGYSKESWLKQRELKKARGQL